MAGVDLNALAAGIPPKTLEACLADIDRMDRARGPISGKLAMARLAIRFGNICDDGKALYAAYLELHGEVAPAPVWGPDGYANGQAA